MTTSSLTRFSTTLTDVTRSGGVTAGATAPSADPSDQSAVHVRGGCACEQYWRGWGISSRPKAFEVRNATSLDSDRAVMPLAERDRDCRGYGPSRRPSSQRHPLSID